MSGLVRVLVCLLSALTIANADTLYSVSPLVAPPGWDDLACYAINNSGQVACHGWNTAREGGPGRQALIVSASGSTGIPLPEGWRLAEGWDINDSGQVAGWGFMGSTSQLFIGDTSGSVAIPLPEGWSSAYEWAIINNSGQVAGSGWNSGGIPQAFIGTAAGVTAIPQPDGWSNMWATGIDDAGHVAGYGWTGDRYQAFLWNGSEVIVLPLPPGADSVRVFGLNASGQTAGWALAGDVYQPYLWGATDTPIPLIPGWLSMEYTGPYPLNDAGQVVGSGLPRPSYYQGWIWDAMNGSRALSSLVSEPWLIDEAVSINDRGQIVARARETEGGRQVFVLLDPSLEPVPEPAAWTLLAAGLLLLAARARLRPR